MKKIIINLAFILFILIGVSVLLYPIISDYFNSISQSRAVAQYFDDVTDMDDSKKQEFLDAAREYNKRLLSRPDRFHFSEADYEEYNRQLDTGNSTIGVLTIEKIDVNLPIYLGTNEGVLQVGVGHMEGTSLPVGGIGTHAFLTGHRGLPSSTLLSDLDQMAIDDTFMVYVMGEILTYQVDDITTVLPEEVQSVALDPDKDQCTLLTCTPYGVNTHRLLVRGQRIETPTDADWGIGDAKRLNKILVVLLFVVPVVIPALIIYAIVQSRKIRKRGKLNQ